MNLIKNDFELKNYANNFRTVNGFSLSEPMRIKSMLQINNIQTIYLPMRDNFSGMAIKIKDDSQDTLHRRFILINSNHSIGKQHFTICHEIYHLYFQQNFDFSESMAGLYDKKYPEEYNADVFASYLLLPEIGLNKMIPIQERKMNKITIGTVLEIEQFYACSRSALIYRLKKEKLIDDIYSAKLKTNVKLSALQYGYDTNLYENGNEGVVIGDYGKKARKLFEEGKISESAYLTFLEDLGIDLKNYEENN